MQKNTFSESYCSNELLVQGAPCLRFVLSSQSHTTLGQLINLKKIMFLRWTSFLTSRSNYFFDISFAVEVQSMIFFSFFQHVKKSLTLPSHSFSILSRKLEHMLELMINVCHSNHPLGMSLICVLEIT